MKHIRSFSDRELTLLRESVSKARYTEKYRLTLGTPSKVDTIRGQAKIRELEDLLAALDGRETQP